LTKVGFGGAKISNILPKFEELFVGHFTQTCAKSVDIEIIGADSLFHNLSRTTASLTQTNKAALSLGCPRITNSSEQLRLTLVWTEAIWRKLGGLFVCSYEASSHTNPPLLESQG
jgi:hypothetical protein